MPWLVINLDELLHGGRFDPSFSGKKYWISMDGSHESTKNW